MTARAMLLSGSRLIVTSQLYANNRGPLGRIYYGNLRASGSTEPEHLVTVSKRVSRNRQMMPLHRLVSDVNAHRSLQIRHQESPLPRKS
jgi:hypothetical protein